MIPLTISKEISRAGNLSFPIVALESTVLTHGLPRPQSLQLARDMERAVREEGATAATVGFLEGHLHIGLNEAQLEQLANANDALKVGPRDFATVIAKKACGGTTVAGTMLACKHANIKVFATGGIGGVHRDAPFDISADLQALASIPMTWQVSSRTMLTPCLPANPMDAGTGCGARMVNTAGLRRALHQCGTMRVPSSSGTSFAWILTVKSRRRRSCSWRGRAWRERARQPVLPSFQPPLRTK